ncbi:MAG: SufE family protein [Oscillospiraceae bacterium]|nr:SufE family protein [Oscillospiraceae bacterium]
MDEIESVQRELIGEFQGLGDSFEQYAYLIELAALLPQLPPEKKTAERVVKGCQSHVWLDMRAENGVFRFDGDSDTFIIKGVLYLLRRMFDGQPLADVAAAKLTLFEETEIMETFETDRQKGIGYVVQTLQRFAAEH